MRRENGFGTIRKRKDGRWEGRYTDSSGVIRYIYGRRKSEISEKLLEATYAKSKVVFDRLGGDVPLDVWFEHYIAIKKCQIKERSIYQIQLAYKNHISPILGRKILCSISSNDIVLVLNELQKKKLSESSINNILVHMRALFNFATKEGTISVNPMFTFKFEHRRKKSKRALSDSEIDLILKYANIQDPSGKLHLMFCTLVYAGVRIGELCGLKWNDFSEDFSSIFIDESITDNRFENSTKSEDSERSLPLNEYLQQQYKDRFAEAQKKDNFSMSDYVFLNKFGKRYTSATANKRFTYLKQLIYEKEHIDISEVTSHYFRHTFATRGLQNGVAIQEMQELLGHANSRTLMDFYVHSNNERKISSISKISDSFTLNNVNQV